MDKNIKSTVERAAELLRENPNLKYYQAIEKARSEKYEMDGGAVPRLSSQENGK